MRSTILAILDARVSGFLASSMWSIQRRLWLGGILANADSAMGFSLNAAAMSSAIAYSRLDIRGLLLLFAGDIVEDDLALGRLKEGAGHVAREAAGLVWTRPEDKEVAFGFLDELVDTVLIVARAIDRRDHRYFILAGDLFTVL